MNWPVAPNRLPRQGVNRMRFTDRWSAEVCIDGVLTELGTFNSEEEAARAHDRACTEAGLWQSLNFPQELSEDACPQAATESDRYPVEPEEDILDQAEAQLVSPSQPENRKRPGRGPVETEEHSPDHAESEVAASRSRQGRKKRARRQQETSPIESKLLAGTDDNSLPRSSPRRRSVASRLTTPPGYEFRAVHANDGDTAMRVGQSNSACVSLCAGCRVGNRRPCQVALSRLHIPEPLSPCAM